MQTDFIKEYWEQQAKTHGESHVASWGDNFMLDLEIKTIGKYITEGDNVLDVGCANGYSTFRQLESHKVQSITGIDFAQNMIDTANDSKRKRNIEKINFQVGDVRALNFADESFDVVYTTRVLINLPTWEQQIEGINECIRVTKKGGKIIFSEAFMEPLVLLNSLRSIKQLSPLVEHDFNRYIKKQKLEHYLNSSGFAFTNDEFSSVYYLGSRFLRDLVTETNAYPGFTNPINEIFYNIELQFSGGSFGIQQAYIITK